MEKLVCPHFSLGESLTKEQTDFFDANGFILFKNFISKDQVALFLSEAQRVESELIASGTTVINGTPLKYGLDDDGNKMIQRMCFLSQFSPVLQSFFDDNRLKALLPLLNPYQGRVGLNEKDGLVMNHYVRTKHSKFSQMGWHTDSPRDLFLGQKIMPMLNVGIHLDDCPYENGGLRVLPGTHKQSMFKLLFGKKYFVDNRPDEKEVGFDIEAGDLGVHDGRLWHRVQQSPNYGDASRRRVMYLPFITGAIKVKNEKTKMPFYHKFMNKVQ
jgi:ectoine hydroxylase-related dioxygenase (phytanoyl-CoA dioxygenase family)